MKCHYRQLVALVILLLSPHLVTAQINGHIKALGLYSSYAQDSIYYPINQGKSLDFNTVSRVNIDHFQGSFGFEGAYQLITQVGDSYQHQNANNTIAATPISDQHRLFDLSASLMSGQRYSIQHRLDRASISYRSNNTVVKFGRQVVSWGNGLMFNPMDLFNPFSPSAVDKEYKTGDDLLYGQYLYDDGDDIQSLYVFRRDDNGKLTAEVASLAIKYHGFWNNFEFDLLAAKHYQDNVFGVGLISALGESVVKADVVYTQASTHSVSAVLNWLYSFNMLTKNISASVEFYHNGFGLSGSRYSFSQLQLNPDLLRRIQAGEVFTLGKNYLASSLMIEASPLWNITPALFYNINDRSALLQFASHYSLTQNSQLLFASNAPIGSKGSEYRGIPITTNGPFLSYEASIQLQLAWYF
ncbi:hypothetical protein [Paraferrimonas sp. SM1919]|uniref:hypothetical protein n=1 Tax=Paraferrimonas sp. SM1919 TaxID=2662263 RepID=UPI0013D1D7C9|nr:hypothetical protein [Paraferrimonas sp. SM1919]